LLEFPVSWVKSESTFDLHDDCAGASGAGLGVSWR
jgi:hypothetical protein